jgi:hypothetical protein
MDLVTLSYSGILLYLKKYIENWICDVEINILLDSLTNKREFPIRTFGSVYLSTNELGNRGLQHIGIDFTEKYWPNLSDKVKNFHIIFSYIFSMCLYLQMYSWVV